MIFKDDNFTIEFDHETATVVFDGSIRLWKQEDYDRILQFLVDIHELNLDRIQMDFRSLEFLNSSGISTLCRFIFAARKADKMDVHIIGNPDFIWQKKSFLNLTKLWDRVTFSLA